MELGTFLQILFGVIATLIALFGIWFTWHYTQGQLSTYPILADQLPETKHTLRTEEVIAALEHR
jgi:hypothetical protein